MSLSHRRRIRAAVLTGDHALSAVGDFAGGRGRTGSAPLPLFSRPESTKRKNPVRAEGPVTAASPEGVRRAVISIYAKSWNVGPPKTLSHCYYVGNRRNPDYKPRAMPGPVAKRDHPGPCKGRLVVLSCGCGAARKYVWAGGCGRRDCPRCGGGKGRAAAKRVASRFLADRRNLQYTVFTVPVDARSRWDGVDGYKVLKVDLKRLVKAMERVFGLEYAYVRVHPTGDDGRTWHPHINLLWVQKWGRGQGRFSKSSLDSLRRIWGGIVGVDLAVVHTSYRTRRSKRALASFMHTIEYVERSFPGWRWQGLRGRWFRSKRVPAALDLDAPTLYCEICGSELEYRGEPIGFAGEVIVESVRAGYVVPGPALVRGPVRYG